MVPVKPLAAAKTRLRGAADAAIGEPAHTPGWRSPWPTTRSRRCARPAGCGGCWWSAPDPVVAAELGAVGVEVGRRPAGRPERRLRPRRARCCASATRARRSARCRPTCPRCAPPSSTRPCRGARARHRRARAFWPTPRAPARRSCSPRPGRRARPAVRGRLGRAAPRVGRGAARRGVAGPAPRRRHAADLDRRRSRLGVGAAHRAPRVAACCDFTQLSRADRRGASAPGWDRITAVGDDASRTPGTGPGPEDPRRARATARSIGAHPARRTRRVSAAARGGTATAIRRRPQHAHRAPRPPSGPRPDPRATGTRTARRSPPRPRACR